VTGLSVTLVCTGRGTHPAAVVPLAPWAGSHVELACPVCPGRYRLGRRRFDALANAMLAPPPDGGGAAEADLSYLS
jgi:hypothetical protein